MTRSIDHGTVTVSRNFLAHPGRLWHAFADYDDKRRWFVDIPGFQTFEYRLELRDGGLELWRGTAPDGSELNMAGHYFEVRPQERILMTYEITRNGQRLSLSILSLEFRAAGSGSQLILTEQLAHLDGLRALEDRQADTEALMDALGDHIDA